MASSAGGGGGGGGGGRRSAPATGPRVVMDSLMEVQEGATRLQTMLQESSPTPSIAAAAAGITSTCELRLTIDGMMSSLSSAMSALDTNGGGTSAAQQGPVQGRRRRRGGAAAGPQRRSSSTRRRSHSPFVKTVTNTTLNDGNSWRKYGQKRIHESPNPRSYYRCTHRPDQGCMATRQVQVSEANPSEFIISYFGQHTCQDPSTFPLVIPGDTAAPPGDCANLISFGGCTTTMAGASSSTTTTVVPPQAALSFDPTTAMLLSRFGYSSSLPAAQVQDYRCGSEEVLSSSSPATQLASGVVVGSAGTMASSSTVGSAPAEYWPGGTSDMAGPGTSSFPSSPSSLGFMTGSPFGSFGNAGDDDLFGFDP